MKVCSHVTAAEQAACNHALMQLAGATATGLADVWFAATSVLSGNSVFWTVKY